MRRSVALAYRLALARPASDGEIATVQGFLDRHSRQIAADAAAAGQSVDARQKALEGFCLVLLNANEFVFLR